MYDRTSSAYNILARAANANNMDLEKSRVRDRSVIWCNLAEKYPAEFPRIPLPMTGLIKIFLGVL